MRGCQIIFGHLLHLYDNFRSTRLYGKMKGDVFFDMTCYRIIHFVIFHVEWLCCCSSHIFMLVYIFTVNKYGWCVYKGEKHFSDVNNIIKSSSLWEGESSRLEIRVICTNCCLSSVWRQCWIFRKPSWCWNWTGFVSCDSIAFFFLI